MENHIVPECYFDTVLVKTILKRRKVNHQKSCFKVESVVKRIDDFALGIIDRDKKQIQYLKECNEEIITDNLILWKHTLKQHYFIQLVPALEKWILREAKENNLNLEDFNLSNDLGKLKEFTKTRLASENEDLKRLCEELIKCNSETITTLCTWLQYLFENNRTADINTLRNV